MATIFDFDAVTEFLVYELDRRKRKNSSYSLRAFSRDLGISASRLSEVLGGTAGMSEKMALELGEGLRLKPVEKKYWLDLILANTARNQNVKNLALQRIQQTKQVNKIRELKEAEFRVISDWYHSAILELTEIKSFESNADWIADQLGISISVATAAIERLKKLKLLEDRDGKLMASPEPYTASSDAPSAAFQKFHQQILTKTLDSIQNDNIEERQVLSMILAVPKNQVPLFTEKMKIFMQKFWEDLRDTEKDDLYSLSLQMVPIRSRSVRDV